MPRRQITREAMARLVESAEFERVLRSGSRATTPHFAVHHLPDRHKTSRMAPIEPSELKLSTAAPRNGAVAVDDFVCADPKWLGAVVPKRHARRSVTRSLIKRQIYAAGDRHVASLGCGTWIVRLRAPFDRGSYPSAASAALRLAARGELESLFGSLAPRLARSST